MNNQIKGLKYEKYIRDYLLGEGQTWLWSDIPEKHLIDSGLVHDLNKHRLKRKNHLKDSHKNLNPLRDTGIDVLLYNGETYILIQCKNGYRSGVTLNDLAGFNFMMHAHQNKEGRVYYTSKLSPCIRENDMPERFKYIKKIMDDDDDDDLIVVKSKAKKVKIVDDDDLIVVKSKAKNINNNIIIKKKVKYELKDFQKIAYNKMIKHFENHSRGILSSPCGTGKTIMGCFFAHTFNSVILLSPLKQYAEQNADRYKEYFDDFCHLIIDSDGTRDIDEIKEFIQKNKHNKMLFSCTFKSVDIVNKFIDVLNNKIVIVDEFHNLSRNNIVDKNDEMNALLMSNNNILFQSATPRVYDIEDTEDDGEHKDIFGDIVYKMDFKTAIEKEYICDYKIYLPSVSEIKVDMIEQIQNEVDISVFSDDLKAKCMYFYKCMLHNGTRKCIIYLTSIEEIAKFKRCLCSFDEYYATNLLIYTLSSNDKHADNLIKPEKNTREWKLKMFEKTKKMTAILSVKILDECVDIKSCDSIYVTHPSKAKRRTIQRMCRCMRKDENSRYKIGNIFIWCNEYDEILQTLSGLKEYDCMFRNKIKLIESNYNTINKYKKNINNIKSKKQDVIAQDTANINDYIVNIVEYKRRSWDEACALLSEFCYKFKRVPKHDERYKSFYLGHWLIRHTYLSNEQINAKLFKNIYVKKYIERRNDRKKWKIKCKKMFENCTEFKNIPVYRYR
jgi:superfamily II DNA or RNA helicase